MSNRLMAVLCLLVFTDTFGYAVLLPLLPFAAERSGAPVLAIGALFASYSLCQLVAAPVLGALSDRLGRRPLLLASQAGSALGFALLLGAGAFWILLLSRVIDGLTAGNISILYAAILQAGGVIVAADLSMGDEVFEARMALAHPSWVVAESAILGLSAWRPLRAVLRRRGTLLPCLTSLPGCRFVRVGRRWPGVPGDLVGAPFEGVSARLAQDGELLLQGAHMFWGYLGDRHAATQIRTGDVATFDDRGRIVLLGRKKDMIIRRGCNIYPGLVEPIIAAIPGVRQCALVGLYDSRAADERVVLAVEVEPGEDARCLEKRLAAELTGGPHAIDAAARPDDIAFLPIPLVGRSRKVDRQALRQHLRSLVPPC